MLRAESSQSVVCVFLRHVLLVSLLQMFLILYRSSPISVLFPFHILRTDQAGFECGLLECEVVCLARHLPIF